MSSFRESLSTHESVRTFWNVSLLIKFLNVLSCYYLELLETWFRLIWQVCAVKWDDRCFNISVLEIWLKVCEKFLCISEETTYDGNNHMDIPGLAFSIIKVISQLKVSRNAVKQGGNTKQQKQRQRIESVTSLLVFNCDIWSLKQHLSRDHRDLIQALTQCFKPVCFNRVK